MNDMSEEQEIKREPRAKKRESSKYFLGSILILVILNVSLAVYMVLKIFSDIGEYGFLESSIIGSIALTILNLLFLGVFWKNIKSHLLEYFMMIIILPGLVIFGIYSEASIKTRSNPPEHYARMSLIIINSMSHTYQKTFGTHPIGNDSSDVNNGKFCGLYFQFDSRGEIPLIGKDLAYADYRASNSPGSTIGIFLPYYKNRDGEYNYFPPFTFNLAPIDGYWFALMKYYSNDKKIIPYDREFSKEHFAIVAFPAEYGIKCTETLIINEEGDVYWKDLGKGEYLDTYPGPDPEKYGWEIFY